MEGIERTNAVVVRGQGQWMGAPLRRDLYAMEVDQGRNFYACGGFGYMACHCRNQEKGRVEQERRLEYEGERFEGNIESIGYLKEVENLETLD